MQQPATPAGPLQSLALLDPSGTAVSMRPVFSPAIYDYVVDCRTGTNTFWVTMEGVPGSATAVVAPIQSEIEPQQSVSVQLSEDQAVVVEVSANSTSSTRYYVRCLPHDFPPLTVTTHADAGTPPPGWYLLGDVLYTSGQAGFAMILDANGTPVFYQRSPGGAFNVQKFGEGAVAYFNSGTAQYQVSHLDTAQTESIHTVGNVTDAHELLHGRSGNNMLLSYPLRSDVDLTGLQTFGAASTIMDCQIQELDPSGNLVWQWRASDHIDPARESTYPQTSMVSGQTVVDVFHCNSIEENSDGDLLISARHLDAVFLISKATGAIKWKLGGAPVNKDNAQIIAVAGAPDDAFFRQHDARFLDSTTISLFDDQTDMPGVARGAEYALDFGAGTATLLHQYTGPVSSIAMGSYRHLPDGSCIVGWGAPSAGSTLTFSEFDTAGNDLLDVSFSAGTYSYRALKVPQSAFDVNLLRRAVAQPAP